MPRCATQRWGWHLRIRVVKAFDSKNGQRPGFRLMNKETLLKALPALDFAKLEPTRSRPAALVLRSHVRAGTLPTPTRPKIFEIDPFGS